jgi:2-phosphosulfolactate phosphatase
MQIDVAFTAQALNHRSAAGKAAVILDVFRTTSTVIFALAQGAEKILPVLTAEEALQIKEHYPNGLLGGENGGVKIPGFNLGNSPQEYTEKNVKGKTIILLTSNGTKAMRMIEDAENVFLASFTNAKAVTKQLMQGKSDMLIACAGTQGTYSLEDTCCGGYLIHLLRREQNCVLSDSAAGALALYHSYASNLLFYLSQSRNGRALKTRGLLEDLHHCCSRDSVSLIPFYNPIDQTVRAVPDSVVSEIPRRGRIHFYDKRNYYTSRGR